MTVRLCVAACVVFASGALLNGALARKGDAAPWGSYFSRGFGGIYTPDDFAPEPKPLGRLEHRHRGRSHSMYGSQVDSYDDTQRTLGQGHGRGDLVQGHIPAVPDAQSRNVPYDSKQVQGWAQDMQHDMQHDWTQDTQQDFQDDTQQDFQDDTQQDFQDDTQHGADPQDFVTGYPPAKGHQPPPRQPEVVIKHTTPKFHHTTYQPPVQHTTYQPEPPVQQTTYQPEPPFQHTTYPTEPSVTTYQYPTTYQTDRHTTYPTELDQHTTTEYPAEKTTYGSYDSTTHPGSSDYEMTTSHPPHGHSEDEVCRPNPAASGYPPGTKLICTVEVVNCEGNLPTKSHKGGVKNRGKSTTLICKPFNGCDDTGYTTKYPEYTTNDHGYTTEHSYTTEGSGHTTGGGYTTDGGYTTEKPAYTTERPDYTTEKPYYPTTHPDYPTTHPDYPTTHHEYPTTHHEYPTTHHEYPTTHHEYPTTHPPTYPPVQKPTLPPVTTPRDDEPTPCVNKPGVKGRSRDCGVKGVKGGVKGGWSSWSSWNPWSEWESKRQGTRKQHTSWLPQHTQSQIRHETPRRPVWNGAWPSSWSVDGSAPVYVES